MDTLKQKNVYTLRKKHYFFFKYETSFIIHSFHTWTKSFFWRRWPLTKRVCKQTIGNANKIAGFYVWNSSLGWYGLKLTFTSFTITCDKKLKLHFTDAYKRNYIIKSWQNENRVIWKHCVPKWATSLGYLFGWLSKLMNRLVFGLFCWICQLGLPN